MTKKRVFSLYEIEQLLKDAGAEKVNEGAVRGLEQELEELARGLIGEAQVYANHAGRTKLIKYSDVALANGKSAHRPRTYLILKRKPQRSAAVMKPRRPVGMHN